MQSIKRIEGIAAVIANDNIDTDQIIPAAHLTTTNKTGLGQHLFSNWRFANDGSVRDNFVLNQQRTNRSKILIAGDNFGCGSSREHAPWALLDFGIQVVISTSIADIFRNNSIKNGLLPIVVTDNEHRFLLKQNAENMVVNVETQTIQVGTMIIQFELEPFARYCFLNGMEQLDFLFTHQELITEFENKQVRFS